MLFKYISKPVTAYRLECDKTIETTDAHVHAKKGSWVVHNGERRWVASNEMFLETYEHMEGDSYLKKSKVYNFYRRMNKDGIWFRSDNFVSETIPHEIFHKVYTPVNELAAFYGEMTYLL